MTIQKSKSITYAIRPQTHHTGNRPIWTFITIHDNICYSGANRGNNTYYKHQFGPGENWSESMNLGGDVRQIQARGVLSGTQKLDFLSILFPR